MISNRQTTHSGGDKDMHTSRQAAAVIGILFIMATVTAILGLYFYGPILKAPGNLVNGAAQANQVRLGVVMELILVFSNIGTAIGLFPVLRRYGERIALGHLFFRYLESLMITIGIISVLALLSLSQAFVAAGAPEDGGAYAVAGSALLAVHDWTFVLGPYVMLGVNTLAYSYLLYKSQLVPRPLAALGLVGAALVLAAGLLQIIGVIPYVATPAMLMAMPIAVYEMLLAAWLIVKGFQTPASARPAAVTADTQLSAV